VYSITQNETFGNIQTNLIPSSNVAYNIGNSTRYFADIYSNNIVTAGNVTGNYIFGNGALLTGVITSVANINSGSSNLRVTTSSGNIAANVGSAGNVLVIASDGLYTTGIVSANSQVVLNSYTGSPEGGQLVLAYTGVTGLTGQGNGTWNLDVNSSNAFRIFTQDESGSTAVPVTVANTGMTVSNVRITGNIDGAGMLNPFLLAGM
jgi:hypothetical protein